MRRSVHSSRTMNINFSIVFKDVIHLQESFCWFFDKISWIFILNVTQMIIYSTLLTHFFNKSRRKIMWNVVLRSLNTENVSDSFFLEELYILGTFKIRTNKNIFSDIGDSKLVERIFVIDLDVSIGIPCSNSVGTVVSFLLYVDSSWISFNFDFRGFFHEEILETFSAFIEIKCKRINSFILW